MEFSPGFYNCWLFFGDASIRQPGGIEETVFKLRESGLDAAGMQQLLASLRIVPVFTAHPTAPTRRTILRKQQAIVRRLVDMQNPALTPREVAADLDAIRTEVTAVWQTEEAPAEARTVFDELEHIVFFLTDVIYRTMPRLYESVEVYVNKPGQTTPGTTVAEEAGRAPVGQKPGGAAARVTTVVATRSRGK